MTWPRGPHLRVEACVRPSLPAGTLRRLHRQTRRAARTMGVSNEAIDELVIQLCGSKTVAGLNLSFRGVRGSTDVLSFPSEEHDGRGDLALDWKYVQRQAASLGRRVEDEAALLIVHGLAHLLGHDHAESGEARRMLRWERRALRAIGVPDAPRPYGGRA